jgi:hypothetical protein
MKKQNIIGLLFVLATLFTGCTQTEFNAIPQSELMGDSLLTTYTIDSLKTTFMTDVDAYSDTINYLGGLYTADLIKPAGDVVINGYVTSTDVEGNVYKYITIQEKEKKGQAMKISIDASGIAGIYPLGQHVWIRCNDFYIGKYGQSPQIGLKYINTERVEIKKSTNDTIYRIEPGRIPLTLAKNHIHSYGLPNPSVIKADTMKISEIKAANYKTLVNKLICIKNAYFTGKGAGKNLTDVQMIFAPSTDGAGYPQSRDITDGTGTIVIATSEYAKFASYKLPASTYCGNVTVIVGWYKNYTDAAGDWQLTLRTIGDLGKGFENYRAQYNK